jgi:hypothetical protein
MATSKDAAASLMAGDAERRGLTSERPVVRYLWTAAFAACNFLALARRKVHRPRRGRRRGNGGWHRAPQTC